MPPPAWLLLWMVLPIIRLLLIRGERGSMTTPFWLSDMVFSVMRLSVVSSRSAWKKMPGPKFPSMMFSVISVSPQPLNSMPGPMCSDTIFSLKTLGIVRNPPLRQEKPERAFPVMVFLVTRFPSGPNWNTSPDWFRVMVFSSIVLFLAKDESRMPKVKCSMCRFLMVTPSLFPRNTPAPVSLPLIV
jgi:hypothetical protein